nr:MAG TPA: hypothetical protein [Crassvirales sp.]
MRLPSFSNLLGNRKVYIKVTPSLKRNILHFYI